MEILVVEDDISFSKVIKEALSLWGYGAELVTSGNTALERMRVKLFDVILLDIYLRDCLGYHLIRHFKRIKQKVNIIAMTGYNSRELEKEVRRQGIIYYMIKPFDLDQIQVILDHIANKNYRQNC